MITRHFKFNYNINICDLLRYVILSEYQPIKRYFDSYNLSFSMHIDTFWLKIFIGLLAISLFLVLIGNSCLVRDEQN